MPSEAVNIGKLMRQQAFLQPSPRKPKLCFKVSKKAVQQYISFFKARIEADMVIMCELAQQAKRKTILEDDVVRCKGRVE